MNIEQKLILSKQINRIILINEGLFTRCYNESAFIVTELLRKPFKLNFWHIKKLDNQMVVYCGFPSCKIYHYFINAEQTNFGFEVIGGFNLSHYQTWFKQKIAAAERCGKVARAR